MTSTSEKPLEEQSCIDTSNVRIVHLKVKIKSLAAEAKIIRREEQKAKERYRGGKTPPLVSEGIPADRGHGSIVEKRLAKAKRKAALRAQRERVKEETKQCNVRLFRSLQNHRRDELRSEARSAQLAYAFLRGVPYRKVEPKVRAGNEPNKVRASQIAERFADADGRKNRQVFEKWLETEP